MWNQAVDWKLNRGVRTGLADIKNRLKEFFAKEQIAANFQDSDDGLVVSYNTRNFQVHELKEGAYNQQPTSLVGPKTDGLIVELSVVTTPAELVLREFPYWGAREETFPLKEEDSYVKVTMRTGNAFKPEFDLQLRQIFGQNYFDR